MERKRECLINYALILLTIAYILFSTVYEYYHMQEYAEKLQETGEKVGYALGMAIVYIFFNLCVLGGGSLALIIAMLAFNKALSKGKNKGKKTGLIGGLVCKIIGCLLTLFGVYLTFSVDHSNLLMKFTYTFVAMAYLGATAHSIICFKKILQ